MAIPEGLPKRKQIRLQTYNYSSAGVYFVTICTAEKRCILSRIPVGGGVLDAPKTELSAHGKIVEKTILDIDRQYSDLSIDKYVIMPNHIHLLISVTDNGASRTPPPTAANARIPSVISTLKRFTNKACGISLWQRSYYEHVVRNEDDYREIWDYIDTNPARWADDCYWA